MAQAQTINVDHKREQAYIEAAKRGDAQAVTELYNAYVDQIYRYIYYRISIAAVAEDLTADVFVRVLEGLPTYEDRSLSILAWMYRIAHARVVDYFREARQQHQHEDIDELQIGIEDDADGALMRSHNTAQVQVAMRQLTPEQQQVIILRFIEGYSLEASAELLGKNINAIKALQYRAVQALNRALSRQGFDPGER